MSTKFRAAIYTRYSSDKQKETTTDDQLDRCRKCINEEGWKAVEHFKDEEISGTISQRPGYQAMLQAAKRKEFDILVVTKLDRFGRGLAEQEKGCERLIFNGIRIIAIADRYDSDKTLVLHRQISGAVAQHFLVQLADNIHQGQAGQVERGYWVGGRCYGYDLRPETDPNELDQHDAPKRLGIRLVVNQEQAKIVRLIFERFAAGSSPYTIAAELNAAGVPAPGVKYEHIKRKNAPGRVWLNTTISSNPKRGLGILNNERYRGVQWWNRAQWVKNPDTDIPEPRPRPPTEWVKPKVMDASLRIVSDELWNRVRARQAQQAHTIGERVKRGIEASGARHTGSGGKYLLSGILTCADCGHSLHISDHYSYACATRRNGGAAACANDMVVKRAAAESKLLAGLKSELLSDENVHNVKKHVRRLLTEQQATSGQDRAALQKQLAEQVRIIENIMAAIRAGILTPTTKSALQAAEAERGKLEGLLASSGPDSKVAQMIPRLGDMVDQVVSRMDEIVADFEAHIYQAGGSAVARARNDLKGWLGKVPVAGEMENGRRIPYA